ncbi:MAG: HAMP domain-containing protein [Deltaproteobacteria bacterium]|nr:HAMP domain-containing protein [Deltaproteobacteria bacterium]
MKLRWQLVLAFAFAATVPIVVAAYGARKLIGDRYRVEFSQRARRIGDEMKARLRTGLRGERDRLRQFCEGDVLVDKLLTDLAAGREPDLQEHIRAAMEGRGLDTLEVVDPRGRVLGSGHLPGAVGSIDRETLALSREPDMQFVIRDVRVRTNEGVRPVLALEHACQAERLHKKVGVVGGVFFSGVLTGLLIEREDAQVFVLDEAGRVISPGDATFPPRASYPRLDIPLHNPDGSVAATIAVAVPDEALHADVRRLEGQLLLALLSGLALALLLALLIARRIASPLDRLAVGVAEIAGGNLEQRIDVRGSREINRLVEAFNRMARDLKATRARMLRAERVAAWREIARRIAHEIKNPLFPIQTSMETLRKTYRAQHPEFGEILEEATSTVLEEVERVKRIVTEFSQFARMPKPKPQELAVEEVVSHVVGLFAGGPGPSVRSELRESLPRISADREQIIQVLLNLVQNARDAAEGRPDGAVRLVAARGDGGVTVRVIDNGTGMSEDVRARMFEPYFTTKETGTGLGLAIVHRIVTEHGGSIEVSCPSQGGTVVSVFLTREGPPVSPEESQADRDLGPRRDSST